MAGKYSGSINDPYNPEVVAYQQHLAQQAAMSGAQGAVQSATAPSPASILGNKLAVGQDVKPAFSSQSFSSKPFVANPFHDPASIQRGVTLMSEISGRVERNRQNQYDYQQQAMLGLMNPMQASDYQPNAYSLYAKYGGSLKTILKDMHKFNNDARMDMDRYQQGGAIPIYTEDKNDPRLKSYSDSLTLYNKGKIDEKNFLQLLKDNNLDPSLIDKYTDKKNMSATRSIKPTAINYLNTLGSKSLRQPDGSYNTKTVYRTNGNVPELEVDVNSPLAKKLNTPFSTYKKPVQPVKYQKAAPQQINEQQVNSPDSKKLIVEQTKSQPSNLDSVKTTNYSFTYPDFKGANSQKTMYFPDENSWKEFVSQQRGVSTQQSNGIFSATGYIKRKKGGLTPNKAREILHDGTAQGHKLTDKQRRYFGAMSKGNTLKYGK